MKKIIKKLRSHKKAHVGVLAALVLIVGAVGYHWSNNALALFTQPTVDQDGGYDYSDYTVPIRKVPKETQPIVTNPNTIVDVNVQSVASGSGSAKGYKQYSAQIATTLWYAWNRGTLPSSDSSMNGYVAALTNPNITVGYDYGVYDADNPTQAIPEGSTVAGGKKIILKFNAYVPDNIFWFGTGYSMDSPYGEWRSGATAPSRSGDRVTCQDKDLTAKYAYDYGGSINWDVYIPLVMNPPTRSLSNTNGLTCGALTQNSDGSASATCTVTGTGTIAPNFNYSSSYGNFYYRYYDYRDMNSIGWGGPGCYGNNIPLTSSLGPATFAAQSSVTTLQPAYSFPLPAQAFPYTLQAGPSSAKPSTPTLSCPAVQVNQDVTISLQSTDPDGDQVKYGADWIDDGTQEVNSGWTGFVPSGTAQNLTKTGGYPTAGSYTIYGWAQDVNGVSSDPASCVVTVTNAAAPDLTAGPTSNVNGSANASVTLQSTIANIGTAPTGAQFTDTFFIDSDTDTSNGYIAAPTFTSGVPNGFPANYSEPNAQVSYTFPSGGTYHYRVCADNNASYQGVITESNEGNNCSNWSTISISSAPFTCTVSATSVPVNGSVTYTAPGGGALRNFSWTPSDNVGSYGSDNTATRTFTAGGSYGMHVDRPNVGSADCPVVTVANAPCTNPSATITASPNRVQAGGSVTLSYTATGVDTSCTITGPGVSQPLTPASCLVAPGTLPVSNITTQSTYKITCDNGESVAQTVVNVVPKFQAF